MSYLKNQEFSDNLTSTTTDISAGEHSHIAVQFAYTVTTPAADTFVDADVNTTSESITLTAHGFVTGNVGQLTTTGVLPTGLSLLTNYYVISVDANTIKLASSYANAIAGTAVDITAAAGGGTHTFTPTTISASAKLQSTVDGVNWIDIAGKSTTISATGSAIHTVTSFPEPMIRVVVTQTAGMMDLNVVAFGKK